MIIKYLIFCIGCALLQNAYVKTPTAGKTGVQEALAVPVVFLNPTTQIVVAIIAILSFIAEVVIGFMFISWWAGLFFWIPALLLIGFILPLKNPALSFILGILITLISGLFLFI